MKNVIQKKTDWDNVALWYTEYLKKDATYQSAVIAPNLLRMLAIKKGMQVLDVACGEGYFSRLVVKAGATVVGIDQSAELIKMARANASEKETYTVHNAETIDITLGMFDAAFSVLSFENIKNIAGVMKGLHAVIKKEGSVVLVLYYCIRHFVFQNIAIGGMT
jgi:ubiquinone/menaquinone biosynthesis C-methylase UbiE